MRPVKAPKLPGHLSPLQKRRFRKLWKEVHNPHSPVVALLGLPQPKAKRQRLPVHRR
jgi:hypothetical protein